MILNSLIYGLDSLFLGVAIGGLWPPRNWPWIAAAFGLSDRLAGLAGHSLSGFGAPTNASAYAPALLIVYAASLFLGAPRLTALATRRLGLVVLPIVLSVDNFVAGAALETSRSNSCRDASTMALASFVMALAGCVFGGGARGTMATVCPTACRRRVTRCRRRDDPLLVSKGS
jgi:putative Mn2+ efflux pump MntP